MGWKDWSYWLKGLIFGFFILFFVFLIFWFSGASFQLEQMTADYTRAKTCLACEKEGALLLDCAIKVCSVRPHEYTDCEEYYENNLQQIIALNNITEQGTITRIKNQAEVNFIFRQCGFKTPKYIEGNSILLKEPRYNQKPFFLWAFFTAEAIGYGIDQFGGLGYIPYLFYFVVLAPIICAIIGWIVGKIKSK